MSSYSHCGRGSSRQLDWKELAAKWMSKWIAGVFLHHCEDFAGQIAALTQYTQQPRTLVCPQYFEIVLHSAAGRKIFLYSNVHTRSSSMLVPSSCPRIYLEPIFALASLDARWTLSKHNSPNTRASRGEHSYVQNKCRWCECDSHPLGSTGITEAETVQEEIFAWAITVQCPPEACECVHIS